MTRETEQGIIDSLDEVLEKERAALLSGDLDVLSELLARKEKLFDALQGIGSGDMNDLDRLQTKITRNQALLDGALRGIRAVADRMSTLRRVRKTLETYDSSGRKTTIQARPDNKVEKRA